MDAHSFLVDGEISRAGTAPPAAVVVMNAVSLNMDRFVSVSAENAVSTVMTRVRQSTRSYFCRHAQPARVKAIDQSCHWLAFKIELLQLEIKRRPEFAQPYVADLKAVELVA